MDTLKIVTPDISVSGQVTQQDLEQLVHEGYEAVLNLRSPHEEGFWQEEESAATNLGLHYVNAPVNLSELTEELATQVLRCIDEMPKPVLIHCGVSMRAGAIALMNIAIQQGLTVEAAFAKAQDMGFDDNAYSQMREFFKFYLDKHSARQPSTKDV